jgi:aminopeptidase N
VLGKVAIAKEYLDLMGPASTWATQTRTALEEMAWNGVLANKGNDNFQRRWFSTYLGLASTPAALDRLAGILAGTHGRRPGHQPGPALVHHRRLNRYDHAGAAALVEQEAQARQFGQRPGRGARRHGQCVRIRRSRRSGWARSKT